MPMLVTKLTKSTATVHTDLKSMNLKEGTFIMEKKKVI